MDRLRAYPRIFVVMYVLFYGAWIALGHGLVDRTGKAIGTDFVTFYAASVLAGRGEAPAVWEPARITAVEREVIGAPIEPYVFHYPPSFLVFLSPLRAMSYPLALAVWWVGTTVAFVGVMRRIAPHPATTGLALAFPGFFQNIVQGQNGGFTAALLGGGLLLVDTRPVLGGALLGLLSYKPHLAPLVGVALLAGRRWVALGAALVAGLGVGAASVVLFGWEAWAAFFANIPFAVRVLETPGALHWFRMPTVQVGAMLLGAPVDVARVLQMGSAGVAFSAVLWAWARNAPLSARAAGLACAALLATPFSFDYDLAVLGVAIAFLLRDGGVPSRATLAVLGTAWCAPLLVPALTRATHLPFGPIVLFAVLAVAVRRASSPAPG